MRSPVEGSYCDSEKRLRESPAVENSVIRIAVLNDVDAGKEKTPGGHVFADKASDRRKIAEMNPIVRRRQALVRMPRWRQEQRARDGQPLGIQGIDINGFP